ncbi:penicillin-binding protein 1A [Caenimonas sp. SL110]|uniref:penicillin-binding protein 1A n=1 Tax=Caenimonas sp. SL110 TaxID=1450524 RepID=UPI00069E27F0|nr:transglycosylase domain-containing protein [Caenimonas sp. SL110]
MKTFFLNVWARLQALVLALYGKLRRRPAWLLVIVPAFFATAVAAYILVLIPFTPSIADIKKVRADKPTVVLSADGKELAQFKRINREWVKLDAISPTVVNALLATEDHRFYKHGGLDLRRTASAVYQTMTGSVQGGSTITQQLARNMFPEDIGRSQTVTRKVKEAITALKIERIYSKDEILEMYLNTVPFLYNAYGIEMAAQTYFDKPARQLDVLEGATLIGMLKGTSYYNPVLNPERAVARRNTVMQQLVKFDKIKQAEFDTLKARPLGLNFERQNEDLGLAPHLTQQLRRWLISWADEKGYNIYADGLVVRTTIDSRLQQLATEAVTRQSDKLQVFADNAWGKRMGANKQLLDTFTRESAQYREAREAGLADAEALKRVQGDAEVMKALWTSKTTLQSAFLAMDPSSGQIRAWVGSRDFRKDQFDHVQQARRQPGSTFKPFVYGAAFEQGMSSQQTFMDGPVEIRIDARTVWKPTDMHGSTNAPMTVRDGLAQSKNTITAQVMQQVGPSRVAKVAYDMGVRESKLDVVPSLALGTSPVTLKEMVSAYSTIANNGQYVEPFLVVSVGDRDNNVIEAFNPKGAQQGLATAAAQTLLDVLRSAIDKGTGIGIRARFGIQGDVAGKTGTTQDNTDGWFILMHPNIVSGAWVGFNDNRITMGDEWGQGSRNALNIVGDFVQQSMKAKIVDTKAVFAAPKETNVLDRMNDWLNSVFQAPVEQPTITVDSVPVQQPARESGESTVVVVPPLSQGQGELIQPSQRVPVAEPREYVIREYSNAPREARDYPQRGEYQPRGEYQQREIQRDPRDQRSFPRPGDAPPSGDYRRFTPPDGTARVERPAQVVVVPPLQPSQPIDTRPAETRPVERPVPPSYSSPQPIQTIPSPSSGLTQVVPASRDSQRIIAEPDGPVAPR